MKALRSIKLSPLFAGFLGIMVMFTTANAQEYDDMYFNKSDRKTVKVEKATVAKTATNNYKELTESTENFSAKNVNPEYIARYKKPESTEETPPMKATYNEDDYYVEEYTDNIVADKGEIDYEALEKRDQMSTSIYSSNYSKGPRLSWVPSISFGLGMGYGMPYGFGYDPFMMPGFGAGYGFSPYMSYSISMSWGTGFSPWGSPYGFYDPWSPYGFYDPWRSPYGFYDPYRRFSPYASIGFGYGMGGFAPTFGFGGYYGNPYGVYTAYPGYENIKNVNYGPRTVSRSSSVRKSSPTPGSENVRMVSPNSRIRVPDKTVSRSSNNRVSRDYSKIENEYYSKARRSSSSRRISASDNSRSSYRRSSFGNSSRSTSSINHNKPSRTSTFSRSSSYGSSPRSYSKSSVSPSRSSSSFGRTSSFSSGSSGSRSSFSSGGSRSSSSGSRSSSSSRGGRY